MSEDLITLAVRLMMLVQAGAASLAIGSLGRSWVRERRSAAATQTLDRQLRGMRTVNDNLRNANHRLHAENVRAEALIGDLGRQVKELETSPRRGLTMIEHAILLDGIAQAGKTCWIARVANPTILKPTLELRRANAFRAESDGVGPVPIALEWQESQQRMVLHVLRLYDMVGEQPHTAIDNVFNLLDRRARPAPQDTEWGNVAVLAMWDLKTQRNGNLTYLNGPSVQQRYGHTRIRPLIKAIYFFMNKKDAVDPEYADEESNFVAREIAGNALGGLFSTSLVSAGSALTGEGVQDSLGGIARALGLTPFMPTVFAPEEVQGSRRR